MGIDKNCAFCGADRVKSNCGGYVVCDCLNSQLEWIISLEKQELKKRIAELSKQISDLKENHSLKTSSRKGETE